MTKTKKYERLRWACRRGMLELDMLLLPFFDARFHTLTEKEQEQFEQLLGYQDDRLFQWFLGKEIPADDEMRMLVQTIRAYAESRI